jgi:hypothetical protein
MTPQELYEALAGKDGDPIIKAVIASIDDCIETARQGAEVMGLDPIKRAEFCGGASCLRGLRLYIEAQTAPVIPEK